MAASGGAPGDGIAFPPAQNHEAWCKKRLEAIDATVNGENAVPELRQVLDKLRVPMKGGREKLGKLREEKWAARERVRSSMSELRKLEREFKKIDAHATHIDSKISRLRCYSRFIESGWQDDPQAVPGQSLIANGASRRDADGDGPRPMDVDGAAAEAVPH
jgi:chromosome segregation ATPase